MLDMQKARLRHLMANAILELWKKETGSQSPVFIEGTVCITSHNGRTTTIQVADQFPGSPQDGSTDYFLSAAEELNRSGASLADGPSSTRQHAVNGTASAAAAMMESNPGNEQRLTSRQAMNGNTMESSKKFNANPQKSGAKQTRLRRSGGAMRSISAVQQQLQEQLLHLQQQQQLQQLQQQRAELAKDDNNNNQAVDAELTTRLDDKLDTSSSSDEDCSDLDKSIGSYSLRHGTLDISAITPRRSNMGGERDGESSDEDINDSAIQDMSVDLSACDPGSSRGVHPSTERPTRDCPGSSGVSGQGDVRSDGGRGKLSEEGKEVVDLSRRDTDLSISSPQSYTDQVRDAIRRRLLASTSLPMLSLGISPLGPLIPTSPLIPCSSPLNPRSSPQDLFRGARDSPYARSTSLVAMGGWHSPQLIKYPGSRVAGRAASGSSPLDVRTLATPFSPPPSQFTISPASQATILTPPPQQRKSLTDSRRLAPPAFLSPASLHKMIGVAGVSTARLVVDQSQRSNNDGRDLSMHADDDEDESTETDPMYPTKSESVGGADLMNPSAIGGGEPRVYRCDYCAKTFLFKSKYHEHLPVHTSARPFRCHLCARTYKYKYDLRVHLRTHLGIPTKSTVCPFCAADKFGTNKQLRLHIREAHGDQQRIGEEQCVRSLEGMPAGAGAGGAAGASGCLIAGAGLVTGAAATGLSSMEIGGSTVKTEIGVAIDFAKGGCLGSGQGALVANQVLGEGTRRVSGERMSPDCGGVDEVCSSSVGVDLNGSVGRGGGLSPLTPSVGGSGGVNGASEASLLLAG